MTNLVLFPSAAALSCAPKPERRPGRGRARSHQMAYMEFLSAVLNRPVEEVVARATAKTRINTRKAS